MARARTAPLDDVPMPGAVSGQNAIDIISSWPKNLSQLAKFVINRRSSTENGSHDDQTAILESQRIGGERRVSTCFGTDPGT
jgi:hypothetical protein